MRGGAPRIMMARLLVVTPTPSRGGAEEYVLTTARAAAAAGWHVTVAFEVTDATRSLAADARQLPGVALLDVPVRGWRRWGVPGQAVATLAALARVRPAVALVVLPWPLLGLGNLIACAMARVPAAVVFQLAPEVVSPGRWSRWCRWAQRRQRWVAVSEQSARAVRCSFGVADVVVIPNGGPEPVARDPRARTVLRAELGLAAEARVVVTVARLDPQKGHADLLAAVARHPDVTFVWVGDGAGRAGLEATIAQGGLDVRLLGHRRDVGAILDGADLFVLPSHSEGLPFALLEALAHGVPVVTSDAGGTPEVVRDGVDGLVHRRGDLADLAAKLAWALDHPDAMRAMAASGRGRATAFSAERMLRETLGLLGALRAQ
jgi:glycosyltransferase involved in cell wall biosynthesis